MAHYEESKELRTIGERIVEKYPEEFEGIDTSRIGFVKKESKKSKKNRVIFATCRAVRTPEDMFSNVKYIITANGEDYEALEDTAQFLVMYHELKHVDRNMDGKLIKHDIEDFASMIQEYGIGWQRRDDLPNILGNDFNVTKDQKTEPVVEDENKDE